jgi:hypothetical protein
MRRLDLAGKVFDRLTVISCLGADKHGAVKWLCQCKCGGTSRITGSLLVRGVTRSCGCLQREACRRIGLLSRQLNPISRTKEYRSALRKRLRENPANAMAERLSRLFAHALVGIGGIKSSPTLETLGFTAEALRKHIESRFVDGMCWENRSRWQIDHIKPISSAKTIEDVIALNQLSNLQPLWAADNRAKRDRVL